MNMENKIYGAPEQRSEKKTGRDNAADKTILEKGAEAYGQAEQAVSDAYDKTSEKVSDAYDKTSEKVSEKYEKAMSYSSDNPGKTILIALGIGLGLGLLLGASTHRSSGRFMQPVVHALSDIASELFR